MEHQLNTRTPASSFSRTRIATTLTYIFFSVSLILITLHMVLVGEPLDTVVVAIVLFLVLGGPIMLLVFFTYLLSRVSSRGLSLITILSFFIVFLGMFMFLMAMLPAGMGSSRAKFIELALLSFVLGSFPLFAALGFRRKEL